MSLPNEASHHHFRIPEILRKPTAVRKQELIARNRAAIVNLVKPQEKITAYFQSGPKLPITDPNPAPNTTTSRELPQLTSTETVDSEMNNDTEPTHL